MANFKTHFNFENKEQLHKLTVVQAGCHQGNNTGTDAPNTIPNTAATATDATLSNSANSANTTAVSTENIKLHHCWMHGLGKNPQHTSATCKNKAHGHQDAATFLNMMGGCRVIMGSCRNATALSKWG